MFQLLDETVPERLSATQLQQNMFHVELPAVATEETLLELVDFFSKISRLHFDTIRVNGGFEEGKAFVKLLHRLGVLEATTLCCNQYYTSLYGNSNQTPPAFIRVREDYLCIE